VLLIYGKYILTVKGEPEVISRRGKPPPPIPSVPFPSPPLLPRPFPLPPFPLPSLPLPLEVGPLITRPDSLLRLWRYINHLLTYLLTYCG